ncbi:hypothetical protein HK405_004574, partial [Cladochytrium tenue]
MDRGLTIVVAAATAAAMAATVVTASAPVWPSPVWDEMEDIAFLFDGYRARGFADQIVPCNGQNAVYLRMGFHDLAGHIAANGTGGIDASLRFELDRAENSETFGTVMEFYSNFVSVRASLSDLIATGLHSAVAACGGPAIPLRVGRVDALEAGPNMVAHTYDSLAELQGNFTLFGFNHTELISLIACAHTLGGVESDENPQIVGNITKVAFDTTTYVYDNKVVTEYLGGHPQNPLVSGPSKYASDFRIFNSDGNATISSMRETDAYMARCQSIFGKLLDSVPAVSVLTDVLVPYEVKPVAVGFDAGDGGSLVFSGEIRVRTSDRPVGSIDVVSLVYKDQDGNVGTSKILASPVEGGEASGGYPEESFYVDLLSNESIASFVVNINYTNGTQESFDNNQTEFSVQNSVFFAKSLSCVSPTSTNNLTFNVVAGVHKDFSGQPVFMNVTSGVRNESTFVPSADLYRDVVTMTLVNSSSDSAADSNYVFYTASYTVSTWAKYQTTFDLVVHDNAGTQISQSFVKLLDFVDQECESTNLNLQWEVGYVNVDPVGLGVRQVIGINGIWPPAEVVAKTNTLDVPTALHFHGVVQNATSEYDGFPGVSQCPIPAGGSYVYKVTLSNAGTFWINSYYEGQTVDGLRIPLIVNTPDDEARYDEDYIITFSDWFQNDYETLMNSYLTPIGKLPTPDALLIKESLDTSVDMIMQRTFRFRLLSMAAVSNLQVTIDAHNMTIFEVDGVYVEPTDEGSIKIAPGQRYSVLVVGVAETKDALFNYLLNAVALPSGTTEVDASETSTATNLLNSTLTLVYGIDNPLNSGTLADSSESGGVEMAVFDDTQLSDLEPLDPIAALGPVATQIRLVARFQLMSDGNSHGTFNDKVYTQPKVPSLLTALSMSGTGLEADPTVYGPDTNPFVVKYGEVTEIVVENTASTGYPFHLHGHAFQVIEVNPDHGYDPQNLTAVPDFPMR